MSEALLESTWRAGLEDMLSYEVAGFEDQPTGGEFYRAFSIEEAGILVVGRRFAEPVRATSIPRSLEQQGLAGQAAALAVDAPSVASTAPPVPRLSGNLAEDVHGVCGLTWAEIAKVFKISERAAAGWRTQGVPRHRQETMEAIRAIGAILVGGLGPEGVGEWLSAGKPSRIDRMREGDGCSVAEEALSYLDTSAV